MNDQGSATVGLAILGAVTTAAPVIAAASNLSTFYIVVTSIVACIAIGAGVGRLYKRWSESIISSSRRNDLLDELVERLDRIEARQIKIEERQVEGEAFTKRKLDELFYLTSNPDF